MLVSSCVSSSLRNSLVYMAAERQFGVCEKQVREWRKQKLQLQQMPKTKRARRGNVASFPLMEDAVRVWVEEKCVNDFIVSRQSTSPRLIWIDCLETTMSTVTLMALSKIN